MNGMATGGKNLQTVFAVAEVKGAYEMGLLSPAGPVAFKQAGVAQLLRKGTAVDFAANIACVRKAGFFGTIRKGAA